MCSASLRLVRVALRLVRSDGCWEHVLCVCVTCCHWGEGGGLSVVCWHGNLRPYQPAGSVWNGVEGMRRWEGWGGRCLHAGSVLTLRMVLLLGVPLFQSGLSVTVSPSLFSTPAWLCKGQRAGGLSWRHVRPPLPPSLPPSITSRSHCRQRPTQTHTREAFR